MTAMVWMLTLRGRSGDCRVAGLDATGHFGGLVVQAAFVCAARLVVPQAGRAVGSGDGEAAGLVEGSVDGDGSSGAGDGGGRRGVGQDGGVQDGLPVAVGEDHRGLALHAGVGRHTVGVDVVRGSVEDVDDEADQVGAEVEDGSAGQFGFVDAVSGRKPFAEVGDDGGHLTDGRLVEQLS